jgi:hypothetical protein
MSATPAEESSCVRSEKVLDREHLPAHELRRGQALVGHRPAEHLEQVARP